MKTKLTTLAAILFLLIVNFKSKAQTGAAMNFDGVNDQILINNSTLGALTIEFWMRTTQVAPTGSQWHFGNGIVDSEITGVQNDFGTALLGSKLAFGIGNPDITLQSTSNVNTGNWVHVAAVYTSGLGKVASLYINGVLEAQNTAVSSNPRNTNAQIAFGRAFSKPQFFNGDLDEVRIWNYNLSQCEIQSRMNCEIGSAMPGLLYYYQFNQGIAAGTNTAITTVTDFIGGNNGSLNNFAKIGSTSNFIAPGAIASGVSCAIKFINVQGNAADINNGSVTTSTLNATNLGTVCASTSPITKTYVVQNNLLTPLSVGAFTLTGASASSFSVSSLPSPTISAGSTGSFAITFTPSTVGNNVATLSFTTNNCNAPTYNYALTATVIGAPTIAVNSGSICSGNSFVINPAGAISYSYSGGSATVSPNSTTSYTVIGTNSLGCLNSNTTISTVSVFTTPTITASSGSICLGQSFNLNPFGATSYTFSGGSAIVSPTLNATYTITGTGLSSCPSSNTVVASIIVNALPNAAVLTGSTSFCLGQFSTLTTTLQTGESVNWYKNGLIISGATLPAYSSTNSGAYHAVVTNSSGCSTTSNTLIINAITLPTATISATTPNFCPGITNIGLTTSSIIGGTYQWLYNSVAIANATTNVFNAALAGQYQVVITNTNGCSNTSTITNLQNGTIQTFTLAASSTTFCSGSLLNLNSNLQAGSSYAWFNNGVALGTSAIGQNTINVSIAGGYYVQVTNTLNCVFVSNTLTLNQVALPTASITSAVTSKCAGDSILISAISVSGANYQWYFNSAATGVPTTITSKYATLPGSYRVVVTGVCTNTSNTINVSNITSPSNAGLISGVSGFCQGDVLNYSISNVSGATSYSWTVSPIGSAFIILGQGSNNITVNSTNQNFVVTVTPKNACASGLAASLNVALSTSLVCSGQILFAADKGNACIGSTIVFTNYSNPTLFLGLTQSWDFGFGASPPTATGNGPHAVTYSSVGFKTVTLDYVNTFNNSFGNETKTNYINIVGTVNTSSISGSSVVPCSGIGLTYSVINTSGSNYNWVVPAGATVVSGQGNSNITVNFGASTGNITVQETNFGGCVGQVITLPINCTQSTGLKDELVESGIRVFPNPNNGKFTIELNDTYKLEIYNILGTLVFQKNRSELSEKIDLCIFSKGIYFVNISNSKTKTVTKKLIIE